jgi:hypothetical protein
MINSACAAFVPGAAKQRAFLAALVTLEPQSQTAPARPDQQLGFNECRFQLLLQLHYTYQPNGNFSGSFRFRESVCEAKSGGMDRVLRRSC